MGDDGTGGGIRIPSMLISQRDGQSILSWMKKASKQDKENVVVMAEFVLETNEENKVDYEFWMTSGSDRALDFLEDWSVFHESLSLEGNKVTFTPHYVFWECEHCVADFA